MKSLVQEYLGNLFGGEFQELTDDLTIGTTASEAAGGDAERAQLGFVNLSANTIWLRPIRGATTTSGIQINANGGIVTMNIVEDGLLPTLPWSAIASGAGSALFRFGARRFRYVAP